MIGIGSRLYLDVASNRNIGCAVKIDRFVVSVVVLDFGMEAPKLSEVAVFDPVGTFCAVTPFRPTPKCLKSSVVNYLERVFADHMAMVIDPAPQEWVKLQDQVFGGCSRVAGDDGSHLAQ